MSILKKGLKNGNEITICGDLAIEQYGIHTERKNCMFLETAKKIWMLSSYQFHEEKYISSLLKCTRTCLVLVKAIRI